MGEYQLDRALERLSVVDAQRVDAIVLKMRLSRVRIQERRTTITKSQAEAVYIQIAENILEIISL